MRVRFQDPKIFSFLVSLRVNRIASPFGPRRMLGTSDEVADLRILEPGTHEIQLDENAFKADIDIQGPYLGLRVEF